MARPSRHGRTGPGAASRLGWIVGAVMLAAVAAVAYRNREQLAEALRLMAGVSPWLLLVTGAAVWCTYLSRGNAYRIGLETMGYHLPRGFLARTALVATTAHHLIPSGGASGYALIAYRLHQRGVTMGQASILALVDTLSNAVALGSLVMIASVTAVITGLGTGTAARVPFAAMVLPGMGLLGLVAALYWLQRERHRLLDFLRGINRGIGWLTGRAASEPSLEAFLEQYFDGKRVITRQPLRFLRMVVWQYLAIGCSCLALYVIFVALGVLPGLWVLFTGLILALAGVSVVPAPAGGGSFELVMSGYFAMQGLALSDSIAATLLFRLVSFWLPALMSLLVVARPRRPAEGRADVCD